MPRPAWDANYHSAEKSLAYMGHTGRADEKRESFMGHMGRGEFTWDVVSPCIKTIQAVIRRTRPMRPMYSYTGKMNQKRRKR